MLVRAHIAHDTGDLATAFSLYNLAVELEPNQAGLHFMLGSTLSKMGDHKGAISVYRKALSLDPNYMDVADALGYELSNDASTRQEAIALLKKIIASDPEDGPAWANLGFCYFQEGRYEEAIQAHKEALKFVETKKSEVWQNLGNDYFKIGDFRSAAQSFKEARERSHEILGNAFYWGGKAEMELHEYKTAIDTFTTLAMHAPEDVNVFIALSDALDKSGDLNGAIQTYLDFLDKHPRDDVALNNVSCLYLRAGNPIRAIECARKAIDVESRNHTNWTTLGEALEASGDKRGAIEAYQRARWIDPDEKDAAAHLKRIRSQDLEAKIETVTRLFRKLSISQLCEKLQVPENMADEVEIILEQMITSGKIKGKIELDVFTRTHA